MFFASIGYALPFYYPSSARSFLDTIGYVLGRIVTLLFLATITTGTLFTKLCEKGASVQADNLSLHNLNEPILHTIPKDAVLNLLRATSRYIQRTQTCPS